MKTKQEELKIIRQKNENKKIRKKGENEDKTKLNRESGAKALTE